MQPYATSHDDLDRDTAFQEEVRNAARALVQAVKLRAAANSSSPMRTCARRARSEATV